MVNTRYIIVSRPSFPIPTSAFLYTACGLFLGTIAVENSALAANSANFIETLPMPPSALRTVPSPAQKTAAAKSAAKSLAPQLQSNRLKRSVAPSRRKAVVQKTTTLKTSGASRVTERRAGSLKALSPEKTGITRVALSSLADTSERTESQANVSVITPQSAINQIAASTEAEVATPVNAQSTLAAEALPENKPQRLAAVTTNAAGDEQMQGAPGEGEPVTATFPAATNSTGRSTTVTTTAETAGSQTTTTTETTLSESTATVQASTTESTPDGKKDKNNVAADAQPPKLYAPRIYYDRGLIVAEGDAANPVRLESPQARIIANKVVLDTVEKTVKAEGSVRVEREINTNRFNAFKPSNIEGPKYSKERITETLQGENFEYSFNTRQGKLDKTVVRLSNFNIEAEQLVINGKRYTARNVVIRPGGLSEAEVRIYGQPPLSIEAREAIVDYTRPAPPAKTVGDTAKADGDNNADVSFTPRVEVKKASLYFRGLRLLPIPSAFLNRSGGPRQEATYQLTPRVFYNSSDGLLATARLQFPIIRASQTQEKNSRPTTLDLAADIGVSTRVGFRGGLELESDSRLGSLSLGARINDVVSSQLTNRIELDRLPELQYRPPSLKLFNLPGSRVAGLQFGFLAGNYRENFTSDNRSVEDTKLQGIVRFTTRLGRKQGIYLDLFARSARYGDYKENLNTQGFEVGYTGRLTSRINGQFSYSAQNVNGSTPFRFDKVEIKQELRTTFDVMLTPRWIVPLDFRYDVDRKVLRDSTYGLLRNYKTFAYGVVYQTSRRELRLEIRQGF